MEQEKVLFNISGRRLIPIVFSWLLAFSLVIIFIRQIIDGYEKGSWNITEWLINYEAGFIRRGLSGQVFLELYKSFGINPYYLIITICAAFYLIFCAVLLYNARRKKLPLIILPAAYLLGGPVINDFWVRKDLFLVLCFIAILYMLRRNSNWSVLLLINVICIIGLLCHETFGFWGLVTIILVFLLNSSVRTGKPPRLKHYTSTLARFLPSIIVFCLCIYFKGNIDMAKAIWISWDNIHFPITGPLDMYPPAAINSLSWTLPQGISLSLYLLVKFSYGIYIPAGVLFTLVSVYFIISNLPYLKNYFGSNDPISAVVIRTESEIISKWLIIQFVLISPLFVLGWDYGRWIFIWVSTSISLFLILSPEINSAMTRLRVWSVTASSGRSILHALRISPNSWIVFLPDKRRIWILSLCYVITGVSVTGWDLVAFFITSPIGVLFQSVYLILHDTLYKYLII